MNNIELATIYLPKLDQVYKNEAKTSILDGDETTVQKGNHGEIKVAKLDMDGLGDFSRNSGYTKGNTKFVWETVKYDKERSQDLRVDRLDNQEALGLPFAKLSSEFVRTKVVPETDAARIAKIAGISGISKKAETISDGAGAVTALRACTNKMDEDEVSTENRVLFITPTIKGMIDDLDTTKSKKVLERFSKIIEVPQTRMYTAIVLNDGTENYGHKKAEDTYVASKDTTVATEKDYYTKSGDTYTKVTSPTGNPSTSLYYELIEGGKEINFLCVEKSAVATAMDQYIKYFTPDEDQIADDNVFKYRNNNLYGHVYENKLAGVYVSYEV